MIGTDRGTRIRKIRAYMQITLADHYMKACLIFLALNSAYKLSHNNFYVYDCTLFYHYSFIFTLKTL